MRDQDPRCEKRLIVELFKPGQLRNTLRVSRRLRLPAIDLLANVVGVTVFETIRVIGSGEKGTR